VRPAWACGPTPTPAERGPGDTVGGGYTQTVGGKGCVISLYSIARLWHRHGKRAEARARLEKIYGWCTEGFDPADLQEAQALLEV